MPSPSPTLLERFRRSLEEDVIKHGIDLNQEVSIRPLGVREAIGDPAPWRDYPLLDGPEVLVEATLGCATGQAFTCQPAGRRLPLGEALSLPLDSDRDRALLVAIGNALERHMGLLGDTIHCRDEGPARCAARLVALVEGRLPPGGTLLQVGYQPAFVHALADALGPDRLRVLDLDPRRVGTVVAGTTILNGNLHLEEAARGADLALATGSSIVNGTLDTIVEVLGRHAVPTIFFGTTIAAAAHRLGLERCCFEAI